MPPESSSVQADYFQLMHAQGMVAIYDTAVSLGVLPLLCRESLTLDELCRQTDTKERAAKLLLDALMAIKLVVLDETAYKATPLAAMLLNSDYRELGRQYWSYLPAFVKTDEPLMQMSAPVEIERYYVTQAQSLAWMLLPAAQQFIPGFAQHISATRLEILDMGCGAGLWSLMLASMCPGSRLTLIDWPAVLEIAKEHAQRFQVSSRVVYRPGNYHDAALEPDSFDIVVLANVTHLETEAGNLRLFERISSAIRPGGRLLLVDAFPQRGMGNATFALYQLGLALRTKQGMVHTRESLVTMLELAGFKDAEFESIEAPPFMIGTIVARKPSLRNA